MIAECRRCGNRVRLQGSEGAGGSRASRCRRCGGMMNAGRSAPPEKMFFVDQKAALHGFRMDNVITFSNQKGGVAKTSSCLNLGLSLGLLNKRVLMIDFDGQANLTLSLGYRHQKSFFEMVDSRACDPMPYIVKTRYPGLWLLPSNSNMALVNKRYFGARHFEFLLRDRLNLLGDQFDVILIDTPPSIEFFTLNALTAARVVVIPCPCEFLSTHGVDRIERLIAMIRTKINPRIESRILVTMFDRDETAALVIHRKLREMYREKLFRTIIERDGKLKESQIVSLPVMAYDRSSVAGRQYFHLAKEILSCPPFLQRTGQGHGNVHAG